MIDTTIAYICYSNNHSDDGIAGWQRMGVTKKTANTDKQPNARVWSGGRGQSYTATPALWPRMRHKLLTPIKSTPRLVCPQQQPSTLGLVPRAVLDVTGQRQRSITALIVLTPTTKLALYHRWAWAKTDRLASALPALYPSISRRDGYVYD